MSEERTTARLLVRRPEGGDSLAYRRLLLDPEVSKWLRPKPLRPMDDVAALTMLTRDERHWQEHGFGPWLLIERESGATVGRGGLQRIPLDGRIAVELPWTVGSEHWGKGYATEAAAAALDWARVLDPPDVVSLIMERNTASRRVAEKIGMRPDGETLHAGLPHLVYRVADF